MIPLRECRRCHGRYHAVFFRQINDRRRLAYASHTRRPVCSRCEFEARQAITDVHRAVTKADRTLRAHADKYIRLGLVESKDEFQRRFGWDVQQMAHDIEHAFTNGCPYCRVPFASMHGGLFNVSLDIVNPAAEPGYRTNVKWVCRTCNSSKGDLSPDDFETKRADNDEWERQQVRLKGNPWGPLFAMIRPVSKRYYADPA